MIYAVILAAGVAAVLAVLWRWLMFDLSGERRARRAACAALREVARMHPEAAAFARAAADVSSLPGD